MRVDHGLPLAPLVTTAKETPGVPWPDSDPSSVESVAIKNVYVHVTKACNLRCSYCYFSARKPLPNEMSSEEFATVWQQLVLLRPEKVVFTGGEPLLRPDLLDLFQALRAVDPNHHILRCLNTNGHLVTPQLAHQLVGLADEVRVSVDALAERNDAVRGSGNFAAALNALESFHAVGFEPKALVTITSYSLPDLENLLCLLFERGITQVNLNRLRPIGRARHKAAWQVNPAEVHAAVERAGARCYPNVPSLSATPEPTARINCGVGQLLNITPNGDVFPCHVLARGEFRCGNLRDESLLTICRRNGPLGRLAALDVKEFSRKDPSLEAARGDDCLGEVYGATKSSPVWVEVLPRPGRAPMSSAEVAGSA